MFVQAGSEEGFVCFNTELFVSWSSIRGRAVYENESSVRESCVKSTSALVLACLS